MKILTLGLGAFGFAVNKLLAENNLNKIFYAYEINEKIFESINKNRTHPYFFDGYKLPENIKLISDYNDIIGDVDVIFLAIPAQFIKDIIKQLKTKLKNGVIIINLAKGIDIKSNKTISSLIEEELSFLEYNYGVLSGGMIASEVVEGKPLGADLGIKNFVIGEEIKNLLENKNFEVILRKDVINIELYGSLKNIIAILVGYYEGLGYEKSTIGYKFSQIYSEIKDLLKLYGGNPNIDFSYYSLGGDLIATCFGNSRNRYFGQLLGEGLSIKQVLEKLKQENKHAEGYETLKAVYKIINKVEGFKNIKFLYNLIK